MVNALDFTDEAAYWNAVYEEAQGPATQAEADLEYVRNVGAEDTERCWILSDRDVWYRNPYYRGSTLKIKAVNVSTADAYKF